MRDPRRRCKAPGCGAWFNLTYSNVYWCCEEHKLQFLAFQREKQKAKAKDRLKNKPVHHIRPERTTAEKSLSHWLEVTERVVNTLCRELALANGEGCISCGTHNAAVWHAGHYRTVSKASQLRFTRININLQCDECNVGKSGNIKAYRIGLVAKYGEETVQGLDNDNRIHRWTIEELEAIRAEAYADLRALKKAQEAA
ncbi:recombination protein NinG [Klebsiella quasipneumoniae]|uniref:recombination protein NinG n=1 Tax=Klebsiella quasipneumoniae TaxID=1463165 RepID=UPI00388D2D10|nr:recombination protein NinG [Klebsiella quasipneumoniae subsp. quasipneumoniae]